MRAQEEHTYESIQTWAFHKSQFVWKFTGKMPDSLVKTSIEHRAFYTHRNNPFSVATLGKKKSSHVVMSKTWTLSSVRLGLFRRFSRGL